MSEGSLYDPELAALAIKQASGDLVEVLDVEKLFDPFTTEVAGRLHAGEEMQEPAPFRKADLVFPSGESLPRWALAAY